MKPIWLTDIHLNFLTAEERNVFYETIVAEDGDCVLITGDIAEGDIIKDIMEEMAAYIKKPIYFVLGNHDYWRSSVHQVKSELKVFCEPSRGLFWLPASGPQELDDDTFLVGIDGWADGREGKYYETPIRMNDSVFITDFADAYGQENGRVKLLAKMQELADGDAKLLEDHLMDALRKEAKKIIVLTHIPPFKESSAHAAGKKTDDWWPFFVSKATGDVLIEFCHQHQDIEVLVLCGHTHNDASYQPMDNLTVEAGAAEYKYPTIQKVITLSSSQTNTLGM